MQSSSVSGSLAFIHVLLLWPLRRNLILKGHWVSCRHKLSKVFYDLRTWDSWSLWILGYCDQDDYFNKATNKNSVCSFALNVNFILPIKGFMLYGASLLPYGASLVRGVSGLDWDCSLMKSRSCSLVCWDLTTQATVMHCTQDTETSLGLLLRWIQCICFHTWLIFRRNPCCASQDSTVWFSPPGLNMSIICILWVSFPFLQISALPHWWA